MSGFLDRLTARAMGEAPQVHPRVLSRFEPDGGVLPDGPAEPAQGFSEMAEERTFETVLGASRAESSPPGEEREPGGEDSARRTFEPPPVDPTRRVETPYSRQVEGRGEGDRAAGLGRLQPRAKGPFPLGGGRLDKGEGQDGGGLRDHKPTGDLDGGRPHLGPPPVPTRPLPGEGSPHLLSSPSELARKGLPTVSRRGELSAEFPLPEESEPSETVVHVSIGRVDVRAAQPPAPERHRSQPAGPRLTLTDYLKRREERR